MLTCDCQSVVRISTKRKHKKKTLQNNYKKKRKHYKQHYKVTIITVHSVHDTNYMLFSV